MWKVLLLVVGALIVGSLILPATFWLGDLVVPLMPQPTPPAPWLWSEEKASLDYCIRRHLAEYHTAPRAIVTPGTQGMPVLPFALTIKAIELTNGDGKWISYEGPWDCKLALTRWRDVIFIAEYSPARTGCSVVAIDLATGNRLWETRLQGIGPTGHSEYYNSVNIETDGDKIIVYGNESHGRYVEYLDINTGKMLLNRKFEPLR